MSEITNILSLTGMAKEDCDFCEECFKKIKSDQELFNQLVIAEKQYMSAYDYNTAAEILTEKSQLSRFSVDLIIALYCCIRVLKLYEVHGYSKELFISTIADSIRTNVDTCKEVYSVIGIFVLPYYKRHFQCERFALGRLQFEAIKVPFDYKDVCKKGDTVLSCHIPATGPLLIDDVEAAFKLAYDFYNISGPLVVVCDSWLLYPPHYEEVFPKGSNISRFYELFDIVEQHECDFTSAGWRVFGTMDFDFSKFPQTTTMQKNLSNFLKSGKKMGDGYGILVREYK